MQLPDNLTPEQSAALVDVIILFARAGRERRLRQAEQQKAKTADVTLGSDTATVKADDTHDSIERTDPYATQ